MKQFILKFVNSETVEKEVGSVTNFKTWMESSFEFPAISIKAIDELVKMVEVAEDRTKIALIDLTRLLVMNEGPADHIVNACWDTFDTTIFQYLLCLDITNPSEKVTHNYHLISLKMLGNLFQTEAGRNFFNTV